MRLILFGTLASFLFGCSSNFVLERDGGDGGAINAIEGGGSVPPPPPGCDVTKLPKQDACVVAEGLGVFVSSSLGNDANEGSRTKPLKTIAKAIDLAKATKRRVYACAEPFAEQVAFADEVSMFGFFECTQGWMIGSKRAIVNAPASPAASAKDITKSARVEGFEFFAPDATMPSTGSIGLVAVQSNALKLVDVRVHAGKGANGSDGVDGVQLTDSQSKNGTDASGNFSCNTMTFMCSGGPANAGATNACNGKNGIAGGIGGDGGKPSLYKSEYDNNISGYVWTKKQSPTNGGVQPANAQTAQGGLVQSPKGKDGAPGADGFGGVFGSEVGGFDPAKLYLASNGQDGTDGKPGQGGGGGAGIEVVPNTYAGSYVGYSVWGWAGASGGAGGCPGLAGTGGKGGGASVAVLAFESALTIESSTLESSSGGDGGKAGFASAPTSGGYGGNGTASGGNGGAGGKGGSGGNGGGGPSFALAYRGTMPTTLATQLVPGNGGAGVMIRTQNGITIPSSPNGKSAQTYVFFPIM